MVLQLYVKIRSFILKNHKHINLSFIISFNNKNINKDENWQGYSYKEDLVKMLKNKNNCRRSNINEGHIKIY